jgi:Ni/Fe-hydrogenase subunit HybB-like protein
MTTVQKNWIKDGLWAVAISGLAAAILRFAYGLGAATGLNDAVPWGLWIAFKLCFVALAGGGFTLAAMVYIFHLETFRPILRRAILIALLGYGAFILSLVIDLGLPWHIYMPVLHWQHHSVMFEIAWCVMLYFSVLAMEFSPVILEHSWFRHPVFQKSLGLLHHVTVPLVIGGIVLSTLHQSSLGSLFLIMPHRVHPLWYSPWIPVLFFASAIAAGLMALVLESFLAQRWFGRGLDFALLVRLGKIGAFSLGLYLALRVGDLLARGVLPNALDGSWQNALFSAEILLGGVLPLILLSWPKVGQSREGLLTCACLVIAGVASQRMSLSMFTMSLPAGTVYIPTLAEVLIAFAVPAAAILLYLFLAENLAVIEASSSAETSGAPAWPQLIPELTAFQSYGSLKGIVARRTGLAVFVIALMFALLPGQSATSGSPPSLPAQPARGWEVLTIDGNSSAYAVSFPHTEHQARLGQEFGSSEAACQTCHHLNFPGDQATACWQCHADYHNPCTIFDHVSHQSLLGGNSSCGECHQGEHTKSMVLACQECHEEMKSASEGVAFNYLAPSYLDALHERCQDCHQQEAQAQGKPELVLCSACHTHEEDPLNQQALSMNQEGGVK